MPGTSGRLDLSNDFPRSSDVNGRGPVLRPPRYGNVPALCDLNTSRLSRPCENPNWGLGLSRDDDNGIEMSEL